MLAIQEQIPLASWMADPITHADAQGILDEIHSLRKKLHMGVFTDTTCPHCALWEMIAHFWQGKSIESDYLNLSEISEGPREQSLIELVYGQLLMSKRMVSAIEHLQNSFMLATPWFEAHEYFEVMKRHELLQWLPLQDQPMPAQPLYDLLREAAVVRELKAGVPRPDYTFNQCDTLG